MAEFNSEDVKVVRNESFDSIASVDFLVEELAAEETKMAPTANRLREIAGEIKEPLLMEDKSRFVLFPIKHHDVSFLSLCHILMLILACHGSCSYRIQNSASADFQMYILCVCYCAHALIYDSTSDNYFIFVIYFSITQIFDFDAYSQIVKIYHLTMISLYYQNRFGRCTKMPKLPFGLQKKWTFPMITKIGRI